MLPTEREKVGQQRTRQAASARAKQLIKPFLRAGQPPVRAAAVRSCAA